MKHGFGRRRGRDFWKAWKDERQRVWSEFGGHGGPPGPPDGFPPARMARAWREFFHDFMGISPEDHWAFGGRRFTPWHQGVDSYNPFVASLLSKGGGLLPLLVMHFLSDRPRYGNEIMDLIAEWTRGQWVANPGAIYPLMDELEENSLIHGKWEDPDKRTVRIYQLTEEGGQELSRLKAIVGPKLKEAIRILSLMADGLDGGSGDGESNGTDDAPVGGEAPDNQVV
jgi:DNA-binding PadR family transcriptional regulator